MLNTLPYDIGLNESTMRGWWWWWWALFTRPYLDVLNEHGLAVRQAVLQVVAELFFAQVGHAQHVDLLVGPGTHCLQRHRMPLKTVREGYLL